MIHYQRRSKSRTRKRSKSRSRRSRRLKGGGSCKSCNKSTVGNKALCRECKKTIQQQILEKHRQNLSLEVIADDGLYNVFNEHLASNLNIGDVGRLARSSNKMRNFVDRESTRERCSHINPHSMYDLPMEKNGNLFWYREGKIHRDGDQPAIIYANGIQKWYKDGKVHRDADKPAIIYVNGTQLWYTDGKCQGWRSACFSVGK